jgi:hypothetical protein
LNKRSNKATQKKMLRGVKTGCDKMVEENGKNKTSRKVIPLFARREKNQTGDVKMHDARNC